jgi:hypothetical protein
MTRSRVLGLTGSLILGLAIVAAVPVPAMAAPPAMWAFAYVDNPNVAPWTSLNPAYVGAWPVATKAHGGRLGVGRFQVRWQVLGAGGGVDNVHVTAVGQRGRYCEIVSWGPRRRDLFVDVACFASGGFPADSPFTVMWAMNTAVGPAAPDSFASVQYGPATGIVQSYNSTGAGVVATPVFTGVTELRFEKVGVGHSLITGNAQVTAVDRAGAPRWCKVNHWDDDRLDMVVTVHCYDAAGNLVDSDFTASYHRERAVVSTVIPPKYFGYVWSRLPLGGNALETNFNYPVGVGANTVTVSGPDTEVGFPQLVLNESHAQATAYGLDSNYCTLADTWRPAGPDILVNVVCFDATGNPAPSEALITFTNRG